MHAVPEAPANVSMASSVVADFLPMTAVLADRAVPTVNVVCACRSSTCPVAFSMTAYE